MDTQFIGTVEVEDDTNHVTMVVLDADKATVSVGGAVKKKLMAGSQNGQIKILDEAGYSAIWMAADSIVGSSITLNKNGKQRAYLGNGHLNLGGNGTEARVFLYPSNGAPTTSSKATISLTAGDGTVTGGTVLADNPGGDAVVGHSGKRDLCGIRATNSDAHGYAVFGQNLNTKCYGTLGAGADLYIGQPNPTFQWTCGVTGYSETDGGAGVLGINNNKESDQGFGVFGVAAGSIDRPMDLQANQGDGPPDTLTYGGLGANIRVWTPNNDKSVIIPYGVFGHSNDPGPSAGVRGESINGTAIDGYSRTGTAMAAYAPTGTGVNTYTIDGIALLATSVYNQNNPGVENLTQTNLAGAFEGNVVVTGILAAAQKFFLIDHPLSPAEKYLVHCSVESDEPKNIYTGNVVLDSQGQAWVSLPPWFEALNGDLRYQLTAVGKPAPNLHIAEEVYENRFKIAGGASAMKVSWQVVGIRHDAFAAAHPFTAEIEKNDATRGKYAHPLEQGQSLQMGLQLGGTRRPMARTS